MSLNQITFSDEQKETLYRGHLHLLEHSENTDTTPDFKIKGNRHSGILWVIAEETADFLNDADTELLGKILQACKLTHNDIAIVNLHGSTLSPDAIAARLHAHTLVFSGLPETAVDLMDTSFYEVLERNQMKMIRIDALAIIGKDPSLKTRLWNCLRQLFQL